MERHYERGFAAGFERLGGLNIEVFYFKQKEDQRCPGAVVCKILRDAEGGV